MSRRKSTHVIEMVYENINATICKEMTALNATEEPMFIKASRQVIMQVKPMALAGICNSGCTWAIQL